MSSSLLAWSYSISVALLKQVLALFLKVFFLLLWVPRRKTKSPRTMGCPLCLRRQANCWASTPRAPASNVAKPLFMLLEMVAPGRDKEKDSSMTLKRKKIKGGFQTINIIIFPVYMITYQL